MPDTSSEADGIIQVMPEALANKIAAGEVVQRPASVLKELLENALDAGASEVEVFLKDAGSELVQVVDDGSGMSAEDARRCFQRHATSKVQSVDDLARIRTLGFRGEALASIAAVARVTCKTKRAGDDAGTLVRVEGGEIVEERPCATPDGTSMAVRSLFYNVPARRNFLKTRATELNHLVETFQRLALSHPSVAFRLLHDEREMYHLAPARTDDPTQALLHRIKALFDDDYPDRLVHVDDASSYLSVRGLVGEPEFTRKGRGEQFLFVNDRYVKSRYLSHAVKAAYGDLLPEGAFPFFVLFLDLDPRRVDINVHPTKAEVKFDDQSGVYGFLKSAVKDALGQVHLTPQFDEAADEDGASSEAMPRSFTPRRQSFSEEESADRSARSGSTRSPSRNTSSPQRPAPPPGELTDRLYRKEDDTSDTSEAEQEEPEEERHYRQIRGGYLVTESPVGLMLVDQQAAHRRVLYEQALTHLEGEAGPSQQLLFPATIELNPADHTLLEDLLDPLRALGFELEPLSGRSVVVRGVPADVRCSDAEEKELLEEVLHQYREQQDAPSLEARDNLAKSIARKGAIGQEASLEPAARRALVEQLFACEMPYADPDGRATTLKIPVEEIEKRFRQGGT